MGYNFDLAFRQAQIDAHQQAIPLMPELRIERRTSHRLATAAGGAVPMMQQHLAMAQSLVVTPSASASSTASADALDPAFG